MKRIEMKYVSNGKAVTKFQIECAEKNSKGEWVNLYISGECWEKQAEFVNQYFQDGSVAIVTGKLYTNVYAKQDGTKVYENKLLFPNVSFAPKDKNVSSQNNQAQQNSQPQYQQPNPSQVQHENVPAQQSSYQQASMEYDLDSSEVPF